MAINRRQFLSLAGGIMLLPTLGHSKTNPHRLLSCRSNLEGKHFLSCVDIQGISHFDIALPSRGHGMTLHPKGDSVVVFARRPGEYLWVIDIGTGTVTHRVRAADQRHYYGHGVFEPSGRYLYVTENDYMNASGVIGIYDAASNYQRIGEIDSHGIGPHEIGLLSDGKTLVVANGGIETHPDLGRAKLNIPTMKPNLAYIDIPGGKLRGLYEPPAAWHQLSIRHFDVNDHDQVCIALQFQGPKHQRPPLVALHNGEDDLQLLRAPDNIHRRMKNYCGSARYNAQGDRFAISSPRGGVITFWSASGDYLGHTQLDDGCGIAAGDGDIFYLSCGNGSIIEYHLDGRSNERSIVENQDLRWDNHMNLTG